MWRWVFIWLLVLVIEIAAVPVFFNTAHIEQNIREEYLKVSFWLQEDHATEIYTEADGVFRAMFVKSGIAQATYAMVVPDQNNRTNDREEIKLARGVVEWFDDKLMTWWSMWLQAIERFVMFTHWLPFTFLCLFPAAVDGWMQRAVKKCNFGYASPVRYHAGMFLMIGLLFLPLLYSFLPFVVSPLFTPLWAIVTAFAVVVLTSNLQKAI